MLEIPKGHSPEAGGLASLEEIVPVHSLRPHQLTFQALHAIHPLSLDTSPFGSGVPYKRH